MTNAVCTVKRKISPARLTSGPRPRVPFFAMRRMQASTSEYTTKVSLTLSRTANQAAVGHPPDLRDLGTVSDPLGDRQGG